MAIPDLPLWPISPNWSEGVLERLEWLTDVLPSDTGVEQRRSVRLSPRRSFEITHTAAARERSYLDLLLHRWGSSEWLLPLWHDQAVLLEPAVVDAQALMLDNRWREFTDGGYAVLYADCFNYEIVEVQSQGTGALVLAGDVQRDWPVGTKVYPLRRAFLDDQSSAAALSSRVGQAVLLFNVNEANDYPAEMGDYITIYNDSPLLTVQPDRSRDLTSDFMRLAEMIDGQTGLRYRRDTAGRAFQVQAHNWTIAGREAHAGFRSFLYTLRGRARRCYVPSFNDDVILAAVAVDGATQIDIEAIGLQEIGGGSPIPGRAVLWTGQEVVRHANFSIAPAPDQERLRVTALANAYDRGAAWSFLSTARLDQDTVELHHLADTDGVTECGAAFRSFLDLRDGSGSNFVAIPSPEMSDTPCGVPMALNPCQRSPNLCPGVTAVGYKYQQNNAWCNSGDPYDEITLASPAWLLREENYQPNGPNGKVVPSYFVRQKETIEIFEYDHFVNPQSPHYQEPGWEWAQGQRLLHVGSENNTVFEVNFYFPIARGPWQATLKMQPNTCSGPSSFSSGVFDGSKPAPNAAGECEVQFHTFVDWRVTDSLLHTYSWNF